MVVSFSATASRKISGQWRVEVREEHFLDIVADRRAERVFARSRRKTASRP